MQIQNRLPLNKAKRIPSHYNNAALRVSSFSLVNQSGKLDVRHKSLTRLVKNAQNKKQHIFLSWSMPEQESGYIRCKKHDFL